MTELTRREILATLAAIGAGGPAVAWALPGPVQERLPWSRFRKIGDYARLVGAVRAMKANGNAASPDSWLFWANIHVTHCPHGKDYFLAWHRGYLSLFEQQLRKAAGSSTLRLPYWDYFADPQVPAELLAGNAATNPLFEQRKGSDVGQALGYGAFASDVTIFERRVKNCFEANVEAFHNNVHNLIGGRMATMQSPQDLIFWLHHANIDRLWAAWTRAGRGRQMPAAGTPYWSGSFDYARGLGIERPAAMGTEALGYRYADLNMPSVEPVNMEGGSGAARPALRSAPRVGAALPPPVTMAAPAPAAAPAPSAAAPVPFRGIWLGRETRSVRMALRHDAEMAGMDHAHGGDGELCVVLDAVTLTQMGAGGGYFYKLYLDLDEFDYGEPPRESRLLGSVGPFQIAAALGHAEDGKARVELPAAELVRELGQGRDLDDLGVVFVRVDAGGPPQGLVMGIERVAFRGRTG